ncbi:MAG: carbonic anhydrase family protein [Cytophagaceae bacterium]
MRTLTKETQKTLTPVKALELLKEGNKRFIQNLRINRNLLHQVNETSEGQYPFAVILSCIDSRTSAELIFDQGLGDIFSVRIAGNILNKDILGSMEFACKVAGAKLILVLGHTNCGAIVGACNHVDLGNLTYLLNKIQPAIEMEHETYENRDGSNPQFVRNVTINNVILNVKEIRSQSKILAEMEFNGEIMIAGGMYDVQSGNVDFIEDL